MKKEIKKYTPKWYKPFELMKVNKELEQTISELLIIIDDYSDELKIKNKQLENYESAISYLLKEEK